jgi:tetratricopeptide (TPR) repeat protein
VTVSRPVLLAALLLAGCPKHPKPAAPTASAQPAQPDPAMTAPLDARSPAERRDDAARLLADATEGSAVRARGVLEQVVHDAPSDATAWYDLGVAQWRLGALQAADEALTRAVAVDPKLVVAWRALALVEQAEGDLVSADARLDQGLALAPEDLDLHVARIGLLRAQGHPDQAIDEAKAALRINSKSLSVYNLMGLAWVDLGRFDLARFVFEKAETVSGGEADPAIQANFGWALYKAGERYPAEKRLKRAVEIDGQFVPGLVYLARFYLDDHAFSDAVPLLERARALAPTNHGVLVDLGIAYKGAGRFEDARKAWERALELRPSDPLPLFDLGILLADDLKLYDEAVAKFQAYVDAKGPEAATAAAYVDAARKDKERAELSRKREEERRKREAEKKERERLLEEARKAEEAKAAEAARLDQARLAEEARKAEEARRAEEARKAEEAREAAVPDPASPWGAPAPAPAPDPKPTVAPEPPPPAPAPAAEPVPAPAPEPVPAPTPDPVQAPTAEPVPAPAPEPVPAPEAPPSPWR